MNLLIVGNSAAGTAAIEAIRRHDGQSSIVQISDEPHSLYSRCLLSYYLAGTIPLDALQYRERDFHTTMRVQLHAGKRAVELDPSRQEVRCDDGKVYPFDKLLIATGSSAKLPENLPTGIEGICVLRTIDDVEMIRKKVKHARNAVVLGGGLIGMKAACALRECGLETKVVVRSNRVLSQMIDEEASQILIERLRQNGIDVLKGSLHGGVGRRWLRDSPWSTSPQACRTREEGHRQPWTSARRHACAATRLRGPGAPRDQPRRETRAPLLR